MSSPGPTSRRWFQMGLRELLGVAVLSALCLALFAQPFRVWIARGAWLRVAVLAFAMLFTLFVVAYCGACRQRSLEQSGELLFAARQRLTYPWLGRIGGVVVAIVVGWQWLATTEAESATDDLLMFRMVAVLMVGLTMALWARYRRVGVDPLRLEARGHGLIIDGFDFVPWSDIVRCSVTGTNRPELHLFRRSTASVRSFPLVLPDVEPFVDALRQYCEVEEKTRAPRRKGGVHDGEATN